MGKEAPERGSGGSDLRVTQLIRAWDWPTSPSSSFPGICCVCVCVCVREREREREREQKRVGGREGGVEES